MRHKFVPVVIVGAGPAGIGVATLLKRCGVESLIIEQGRIGESFLQWPVETRFISPSFTGNFFGAVDLNAITPESSPAFGLQTEHPTGEQYAKYLNDVVEVYELEVKLGTKLLDAKIRETIMLTTSNGITECNFLIWAGGEAQFPKSIPYTVRVESSYRDIPVGKHIVVGGSESGIDAAYYLVKLGSSVLVLDPDAPWKTQISDSSYGLSPYTFDRLRFLQNSGSAQFLEERTTSITANEVRIKNHRFSLDYPAINATGFDIRGSFAGKLFSFKNNFVKLTEQDESTKHKNVFLVGPSVRHDKASFCFIYKYRQRFAVVTREILARLGQESDVIEEYKKKGFLLDDLSCCGSECAC